MAALRPLSCSTGKPMSLNPMCRTPRLSAVWSCCDASGTVRSLRVSMKMKRRPMMVVPFDLVRLGLRSDQALCVGKRRFQARVICNPLARDVERRAVVRAGADERQAQRDVHAFFQPEIFHRDQPLIVVLGHDNVESTL